MAEKLIRIVYQIDNKDALKTVEILKDSKEASKKFEKSLEEAGKKGEKSLSNVKKGAEDAQKPFLNLKGAVDSLLSSINAGFDTDQIQKFGTSMVGTSKAVSGASAAFKILRIAIAATGIGLLIAAVVSLIAYFKRTDEGAAKLDGIMRAIGNTITLLAEYVINFGKAVFDAFSNPVEAIKKLGDFIVQNIINRFTAVITLGNAITKAFKGDFAGAMKTAADAAVQFSLGITNATDKIVSLGKEIVKTAEEGFNMALLWDELEDKERAFGVTNAKAEKEIGRLLIAAKNRTKSEEERIALLDQAAAIEKANFNEALSLAQKRLEYQKRENAEEEKYQQLSDEADQKRVDAEIAVLNLERESLELNERINNRKDQLLQEFLANRLKANEEILKMDQALLDKANKLYEESFKKQDLQTRDANDKAAKAFVDRVDKEIKALADANARKEEEEKAHQEKVAEIRDSAIDATASIVNSIATIQNNQDDARLERLNRQKEQELAVAGDNAEARKRIEEDFAKREGEIRRRQAERDKRMAIFNAIINTAQAVIKAVAISPATGGLPFSAIAAAVGAAQIAAISSQQIPAFAKGTKSVQGGQKGKDSVLAKLMPEEMVIPVATKRKYEPALNAIFDNRVSPEVMNGIVKGQSMGTSIDYDLLAQKVMEGIKSVPLNVFSFDEKGFTRAMQSKAGKTEYLSKKYSGK